MKPRLQIPGRSMSLISARMMSFLATRLPMCGVNVFSSSSCTYVYSNSAAKGVDESIDNWHGNSSKGVCGHYHNTLETEIFFVLIVLQCLFSS